MAVYREPTNYQTGFGGMARSVGLPAGYGEQGMVDIGQQWDAARGAGMQDLVSRGMTGGSVMPSMAMGYERQKQAALARYQNQLWQQLMGYRESQQQYGLQQQQYGLQERQFAEMQKQWEKQFGLQSQEMAQRYALAQQQLSQAAYAQNYRPPATHTFYEVPSTYTSAPYSTLTSGNRAYASLRG